MKLNNRGYAVAGILYATLLMFLILLSGILSMMSTRKVLLDKMKKEVLSNIDNKTTIYNEESYLKKDMVLFYDGITNVNLIGNNEIENNVFKDLTNNNDGSLLSFDYNSDSGWGENYLKFDGVNDIVSTGIYASDFATANDSFTMTMLVKINKVTADGNASVSYDSSTMFGATYYSGYGIFWSTSDSITTQYNLSTMMRNNSGTGIMTYTSNDFAIQHIAYVYNKAINKQYLYVNGNKVAERTAIEKDQFGYPSNMGNIQLGGSGLYGGNSKNVRTDMNLYSAKIYKRALTLGEVNYEYKIDKYRYNF